MSISRKLICAAGTDDTCDTQLASSHLHLARRKQPERLLLQMLSAAFGVRLGVLLMAASRVQQVLHADLLRRGATCQTQLKTRG
jgi:hypothetical protein